ncbi:phage terminase large subunit [Oceanidesulfovibrio marinus]|uniref:Terminase-like family protein n=1 Tax=Oceanidesulfovibrio marinus TaxID=370038 RepID=A0A6P1ZCU7_9BACT|nr:phage terminase large subunit [Oceanidesulfovibrio marinus]TVM31172.1 Terminase-like family protein [Oceanidesulfovibrio marinus]
MTNDRYPDFDTELAKFSPRQMAAVRALDSGKVKYLLYGGALGGGKSYFERWWGIRRLIALHQVFGLKEPVGMLACENYPALKDRQLQKITREIPEWLGRYYSEHSSFGRCFKLHEKFGGGALVFRNLDDPSKYASAEFAFIEVDELTKNTYDVFTFLRSRLRWPGLPDIETQFVGATNPGSVGHGWVKQLWMDRDFPLEWIKPIDYRPQFHYVPSLAKDNPHLDPTYWATLQTLPPNLRRAFAEGDWDLYVGQAFPEFSRQIHVVPDHQVPAGAPLYMTFDWGFSRPFSVGWWYVDPDGRVVRFSEWYGWNGTANEGNRIPDSQIAEGIIAREVNLGFCSTPDKRGRAHYTRTIIRLGGHDCFNKKPDYQGGGQGKSTAEVFAEHGLYLTKADAHRLLKIRQFRERLMPPENGDRPMMLVMRRCKQFIRTIPNLVMDERNPEDLDTDGEDHIYDEACHICMARPIQWKTPERQKSAVEKRLDRLAKAHHETDGIPLLGPDPYDNDLYDTGGRGGNLASMD